MTPLGRTTGQLSEPSGNEQTAARCDRCGDPLRDHVNPATGELWQGYRASRFTGTGFCNAQHKSGGIVGSLQWCGCLGYQPRSEHGRSA